MLGRLGPPKSSAPSGAFSRFLALASGELAAEFGQIYEECRGNAGENLYETAKC
jgi:hypothetical protein